jgi:hypothetical protein
MTQPHSNAAGGIPPSNGNGAGRPVVFAHAPLELTDQRLSRLGEGIGKVVYASEHWVVKRERSPNEVIALIAIWKMIRWMGRHLPGRIGHKLLDRPSKRIRLLRVMMQAVVVAVPRSIWLATHIGEMWHVYGSRSARGERLADAVLAGTALVPRRITFPPVKVKVGGWPGWLTASDAVERVEATLHQRLAELSLAGRFRELEQWLDRFLELRQSGWRLGLYSVDPHLKNFGVIGERVVLIDPGGLTDQWAEVESHLCFEDVASEPHVQLGLGGVLGSCSDVAERFNARWRAIVNADSVKLHWPVEAA